MMNVRTVIDMTWCINVTNIVVNSISNNANINYGPTYQNSHTANTTIIGGNFTFGDYSPILSTQLNKGTEKD